MNALQKMPESEVPAVSTENPLMALITRAASDPSFDVEKMKALLSMKQELDAKEAERQFSEAMNDVQKKIRPVVADANNPQTKSKYATYEHLDYFLRPIYTQHGFSLSFGTGDIDRPEMVRVTAKLRHSSGHSEPYHVDMPADGKGAKGGDVMTKTHATGSAMSYGKRYLLIAMFNIPVRGEDDDGNRAGNPPITADQKAKLIDRIKELGVDTTAFLKHLRVMALDDLPTSQFASAMKALDIKETQMKKAQPNE